MSDKAMNLYLLNLKMACELIDSVFIPTVKTFDSKVFNARLHNKIKEELQKVNKGLCVDIEFDVHKCEFELCFYGYDLRSYSEEGKNCCFYLPDGYEKISVARIWSEFNGYYHTEKNEKYYTRNDSYFWLDGNNLRINSDAIIQDLQKHKQSISESISVLYESMKHVSEYKERLNVIKEELEKFNHEIPYAIKSFYDIKSYATWSR